ncbi:PucR family transcriptional regulator [Microbacterium sp.]|uniref:PucR family transcriptional regulator n=1 Tax=Microbacterium sp. TaxID=51671 RepID=UPI0028122FCA|nr:PucR family transcriptional regulator [Microbacterium sp.]
MDGTPTPTLRALLGRRDLRLRLVLDEASLAVEALDRPMRWVHSSDLTDPTPFLADDLVLLTTGTQFDGARPRDVDAYVARLAQRGVLGLGFGSGVHRVGVPAELIAACAARGLALFEVPYDIPFIAIARAHAEAIAAQAYARRTWALETQRALAIAALRPRGLEATLTELARRLDCWVGMYDASGALVHEHPHGDSTADPGRQREAIASMASALLARGGSASRTLEHGGTTHTLFTLGRTGHLRGVIAIAAAAHDPETRAVVTSVIAMAGLALEQGEQLSRSRRRLHRQLLGSLLEDDPSLARRVLGALPPAPVVVALAEGERAGALAEWADQQRSDAAPPPFVAESADGVVICLHETDAGSLEDLATRFAVRIGVSDPADYSAFSRAHAQAAAALRRGRPGVTLYRQVGTASVLSALLTDEARLVAASRLAPLRAHDAQGGELERSLRVWLEHDAQFEQAASALGIHRHTLRTRVAQAGTLLGVDLGAFPARAELWAALQAAQD